MGSFAVAVIAVAAVTIFARWSLTPTRQPLVAAAAVDAFAITSRPTTRPRDFGVIVTSNLARIRVVDRAAGIGIISRGGTRTSSLSSGGALSVSLSPPPPSPSSPPSSSSDDERAGGAEKASAKTESTARSVALRALSSPRDYPTRALESDPAYLELDSRDRAFARNLVATVERRAGQLDGVLGRCADRYPPKGASDSTNENGKAGGAGKAKGRGKGKGEATTHGDLVRAALRMGSAQLLFLDVPPYAAVKETVDSLRSLGRHTRERGRRSLPESQVKFVNAVLRRVQREGAQLLEEHTSPKDNVAGWLVQEWTDSWGEDITAKMCERMMLEPRVDLTPNLPWDLSPEEREDKLEELRLRLGDDAEILPQGSIRGGRGRGGAVSSWPGYDEGLWWVQDVSSTIPALALRSALLGRAGFVDSNGGATSSEDTVDEEEPREMDYSGYRVAELKELCRERSLPVSGTKAILIERLLASTRVDEAKDGEGTSAAATDAPPQQPDISKMHVVDMCAAPGGKTSQLLNMGFGRVTAVEANARRSRRLVENMDRLGFSSGEDNDDSRCEVVVSRGQDYLLNSRGDKDAPPPSGVLLDVPCSATGTGTRRPDVLRRSSDLGDLPETQRQLARHVADEVLDVGGILVYATCSLLEREGEEVVEELLKSGKYGRDGDGDDDGEGGEEAGRMELLPFQRGEIPGFDDAIHPDRGWMRVLPGTLGGPLDECDGFFVASLIKTRR